MAETAAAVITWLGENAATVGAVSGAVGAGTAIYGVTQQGKGGAKASATPVSAEQAASTADDEERRKRAQRMQSLVTRNMSSPSLGQPALMGV